MKIAIIVTVKISHCNECNIASCQLVFDMSKITHVTEDICQVESDINSKYL